MTQDEIDGHVRKFLEQACDNHAPTEAAQIELLAYSVIDRGHS